MRLEQKYSTAGVGKISFQFHKGAIRTICLSSLVFLVVYFNSIKVRLELVRGFLTLYTRSYFNSIKVRLEPLSTCKTSVGWWFQFHKGAIRTDNNYRSFYTLPLFQFHKGAIRTFSRKNPLTLFCYFNSIKVRLEQFWNKEWWGCPWFQFHKGAIRTR